MSGSDGMKVLKPNRLVEAVVGYRKAKILMVAANLNCFTILERPKSAAELADCLNTDPRATEILLDSLVSLGLLKKRSDFYHNTAFSSRFLVEGRPDYFGDNLKYQNIIWEAWSELQEVLRRGSANRSLEYWMLQRRDFTKEYVKGMANIASRPAQEIAALVPADGARRLLDVGAGPGTYSMAFLKKHSTLRATLLDLPVTLKVTRRLLASQPDIAPRIQLLSGDYCRASFGCDQYDLILLSHITHNESEEVNRRLIQKSYQALRKGGKVVVHDFMVNKRRTAPLFGALFAVHMLVYTKRGRVYSMQEYKNWLQEGGFKNLAYHKIAKSSKNPSGILVGVKN